MVVTSRAFSSSFSTKLRKVPDYLATPSNNEKEISKIFHDVDVELSISKTFIVTACIENK